MSTTGVSNVWTDGVWSVIECNRVFLQKVNRSDLAILVLTGHAAVLARMLKTYTSGQLLSMAALSPGCNYRLVAEYLIGTAEHDRR